MRNIYLFLAIVGALVPYLFFIQFFAEHGLSLPAFVGGLFANGAAGGFTADVLIPSAVFWYYMFNNRQGPKPLVFVLLNLTIGLSCALPAYLWAASRETATTT